MSQEGTSSTGDAVTAVVVDHVDVPATRTPDMAIGTDDARPAREPAGEVDRPTGWAPLPSRREHALKLARAAAADLRVVHEQPASLKGAFDLARRGAWTTSENGPLRCLAVAHFWGLQVPLLTLGTLVAWSARTPGRVWTAIPLLLTLATALDQVPVVGLLIPEFLTWPYWPPFYWINRGDTP